jgi:hypothetical protein
MLLEIPISRDEPLGGGRASCFFLVLLSLVPGLVLAGCLDPLGGVHPVKRLRAVAASVDIPAGASGTVAVQAVDVNGAGVDGARVTFTRGAPTALTFEGNADSVDAVTVTTATTDVSGVSASGIAVAHLRSSESVAAGETSIIAVVKDPTEDVEAAVSARIQVRIGPKAIDGGTDGGAESSSDGAVGAEVGGAS